MSNSASVEFDRLLLASFQPEGGRAASQLARAVVSALSGLKARRGFLIIQLDELLGGADLLFPGVPFLPAEPVCACLTGTGALVAAVASRVATATKARFATARLTTPVTMLRIGAFVSDGKVVLDINREFGGSAPAQLTRGGWAVQTCGEEEGLESPLLEAEALLERLGEHRPTKFIPKAPADRASRSAKGRS